MGTRPSVVMAQAFGPPFRSTPASTDWRAGPERCQDVEQTERDLKRLFPKSKWNAVHLQIIYFGREYCPARYHDLTTCPICSWASTKKRQAEEARSNAKLRRRT